MQTNPQVLKSAERTHERQKLQGRLEIREYHTKMEFFFFWKRIIFRHLFASPKNPSSSTLVLSHSFTISTKIPSTKNPKWSPKLRKKKESKAPKLAEVLNPHYYCFLKISKSKK